MRYIVTYSSNNSGGRWWLKDEHWKALEADGWKVDWVAKQDREFFKADENGRWLGALATNAELDVVAPSPRVALKEAVTRWEAATKADPSDEGCNCCGSPHSFRAESPEGVTPREYEYLSAEDFYTHQRRDPW